MLERFVNAEWSMRSKLVFYMLTLAVLLLFALISGIMMLGRFDGAEKSIGESLEMQMKVFEKDMSAYFESTAASSIDLSRYVSDFIDNDSEIAGKAFSNLTDNPQKIEQLQAAMIPTLTQKLESQNCSGIFVMLNATVNSKVEDAALSRTGLYLQHNRYQNDDSIILFRGNSSVGKTQDVMPHRKWRLEFRTDQFPSYNEAIATAKLSLNEGYMLTECTTLAGTSDDVVLMTVPIVGKDGTFYGLCGFEISADYFATYHAQPATENHLVCMLLSAGESGTYASMGLSCNGQNGYMEPPEGSIIVGSINEELTEISDGSNRFVGTCKEVVLTPNNSGVSLAAMIPETDYTSASLKSGVQVAILIVLLLFFAISCSVYFSRKYLQPILKGFEQIKHQTWQSESSSMPEINDLFAYLAKEDERHNSAMDSIQEEFEQAQLELRRLSYSRKSEVDPDNYQAFLNGLKLLTPTERTILDHYLEGKSVKQIMEIAGIKETTLRYHNRNIYSKLSVNSLKQLLLYAAMMKQTESDEGCRAQ